MGKGKVRSIVIEYDSFEERNVAMGRTVKKNTIRRIISWPSKNGKTNWKELKCPQNSFHGVSGYYRTLGLDVQFYNRTTKTFHRNLPN